MKEIKKIKEGRRWRKEGRKKDGRANLDDASASVLATSPPSKMVKGRKEGRNRGREGRKEGGRDGGGGREGGRTDGRKEGMTQRSEIG
jgi:hypothetical protein